MVNVAELLELKFGNSIKPSLIQNQGMVTDEVRFHEEVKNEVKVEGASNPNVVEGLDGKDGFSVNSGVEEGGFMKVDGEVGGFGQTRNELSVMDPVVDLRGVSEEVKGFEQPGINLVVDLSPRGGLMGNYGCSIDRSKGCSGGLEEHMGEECMTEIEGNYEVTDLVWGKVRSHPWWPGQIFDPDAASQKAKKHSKKGSFLIAYFGDQTYAWNDASQIKPFRKHFSRMVKQSNTEAFRDAVNCALHEVSRRIEFGLACSCLPEDMFMKIKSQVVVNAGISEKSRRRDGGDRFSSVASFEPAKLVEILKALAVDPSGTDRLEFVKASAQLTAYHRWKSYYQLPIQTMVNGLVENADSESDSGKENVAEEAVTAHESNEEVKSRKGKSTGGDRYLRKRKNISTNGTSSNKKSKLLSELTSNSCVKLQQNLSVKAGRKRKAVDSLSEDSRNESVNDDKKLLTSRPKRARVSLHKIAQKLSRSARNLKNGDGNAQNSVMRSSEKPAPACHVIPPSDSKEARGVEVPPTYPPTDEILWQLHLGAKDPMKENNSLTSLVQFFKGFRSYSAENLEISNNSSPGEVVAGETAGYSPISRTENVEHLSVINGIEDSYWTDRIIQCNPEEQVLFEPEFATLSPNPKNKQGITVASLESAEKPAGHLDNKCEEYSGTALILSFDKKASVPSVTSLTDIYTKVGPLKEVSRMNKRAKVVFERSCDAETAFSSAGKYSLFGPSLLSYSLDYSPTPRKITTRARKQTEDKDSTLSKE